MAVWPRNFADARVHVTTGQRPIQRFLREVAQALRPLAERPSFVAVRALATGRCVANGDALLPGRLGGGKTYLAKAQHENRLEDKLLQFAKSKLLIIDDLGRLTLEPDAVHLMFQPVSRRYRRGSLLVTSNLATSEWGAAFGAPVVTTTILDRLLHHSHVVTTGGDSDRLREKRKSGQPRPVACVRC